LAAFASFFNDLSITENYACKFIITTKQVVHQSPIYITHKFSNDPPGRLSIPGLQEIGQEFNCRVLI
jgi:hypothetical protein